jgi:hypothetical protein
MRVENFEKQEVGGIFGMIAVTTHKLKDKTNLKTINL